MSGTTNIWYKEEKEDDYRLDRYDYLHKRDQLDPWVPQINEAELKESKVRIYFNNHARAKSVRNAFLLMDLLLIGHQQREIKSQDQFTLGEFQRQRQIDADEALTNVAAR